MKKKEKQEILKQSGILRGELRITGEYGEKITFPFSTSEPDEKFPIIELKLSAHYGTPNFIGVHVLDAGLQLWTSICSPLDKTYEPLYVRKTFSWKDVAILWYQKNCQPIAA